MPTVLIDGIISLVVIVVIIVLYPTLFPPKRDKINLIMKNGYLMTKSFRRFPVGRWEFTSQDGTKELYETNYPQDIVTKPRRGIFGIYTERHLFYHQGIFKPISRSGVPDASELNKIVAGILHDVTLRALLRSKESIIMLVLVGIMALSIGFTLGLVSAPHIFGLRP
jgi:hypothetical protein